MQGDTRRDRGAPPIRVVIADDHAILREPLRAWLEEEPGFAVVGEASDGAEAVQVTERLHPDILLLDLAMPVMDGADVAKVLRTTAPTTRIVVLTGHESRNRARALAELGVSGYVGKGGRLDHLVAVLRLIHTGHRYISPIRSGRCPQESPTPRELEVLRLVAEGFPTQEISKRLSVCVRTIEGHVSSLATKLGTRNRAELVHRAHHHGWLT